MKTRFLIAASDLRFAIAVKSFLLDRANDFRAATGSLLDHQRAADNPGAMAHDAQAKTFRAAQRLSNPHAVVGDSQDGAFGRRGKADGDVAGFAMLDRVG